MLILNPASVKFGSLAMEAVSLVVIERVATKLALEWSDRGPHVAFADVPEQKAVMRVVHEPSAHSGHVSDGPRLGDSGTISVVFAPNAGHGSRKRLMATGVVVGVKYEVRGDGGVGMRSPRNGAAQRQVEFVLVSVDGEADPVMITDAEATT